jgi:hypothetical protein
MEQTKENLIEIVVLAVLLWLIAMISFSKVDESICLAKYHFQCGISNLINNYSLYHHSPRRFLFETSAFHPGNSESGWKTVSYLLPLFIFSDLLGGLSLKTTYLFTITASLMFLVLFYGWVRRTWGKEAAFFGTVFLGFSSAFQEIARSGSYDTYSTLLAMGWVWFFFQYRSLNRLMVYFWLGLLTGLIWYGYGILRCLTLVGLVHVISLRNSLRLRGIALFLCAMMAILIPGLIIKIYLLKHPGPWQGIIFDKESVFEAGQHQWNGILKEIMINLKALGQRMMGANQLLEPVIKNKIHAPFWNPILVVPLFIGGLTVFFDRQKKENQMLFLLAIVIYFVPCLLTSSGGYLEARRSLLYIIPSYCLIGLGLQSISQWISATRSSVLRWTVAVAIAVGTMVVSGQEWNFFNQRILNQKPRDLGLLEFAQNIKQKKYTGLLYYLEEHSTSRKIYDNRFRMLKLFGKASIYQFCFESSLLSMALLDHGQSALEIKSTTLEEKISDPASFYLAKSPIISQSEFDQWCVQNDLQSTLVFSSPLRELPKRVQNLNAKAKLTLFEPFKFYKITKKSVL